MVAWCLELDGRRDRDEFAKPIVGRGTGPAVDPVTVFSLVRFQEKEMRKAARKKSTRRTFRQCAKCRNEMGDSPADVLGG